MANLFSLPTELLGMILSHLHHEDCLALVKVSKLCYYHAEGYLYQELIHEGVEKVWERSEQHRRDDIPHFVRSILARPELSKNLVRIRSTGREDYSWRKITNSEQARNGIRRLVNSDGLQSQPGQSLRPELQDSWANLIDKGSELAAVTFVLLQSTNIQSLILDVSASESVGLRNKTVFLLIGAVLQIGAASLTQLKSVTLSVKYYDDRSVFGSALNQAIYRFLFQLPSIEHIKLLYVSDEPFAWTQEAPTAPSLRSLQIIKSRINTSNLATWLDAAPNLQSLVYRFGINPDGGEHRWLHCEELKESLERRKKKLTSIALHLEIYYSDPDTQFTYGTSWGFLSHLGSFRDFDVLTSLTVPLTMLLGRTPSEASLKGVLPPSLIRFFPINDCERPETVDWDITDIIAVLRAFALNYKAETPKLEMLSLCTNEDGKWLRQERQRVLPLFEVFSKVGLAFKLVPRGEWLRVFK